MRRQSVIGLIGGLSWESSAEYYRILNETMRDRLGPLHSARCLMWSFDFAEIEALQHAGRWDAAAALMIDAARRSEHVGDRHHAVLIHGITPMRYKALRRSA